MTSEPLILTGPGGDYYRRIDPDQVCWPMALLAALIVAPVAIVLWLIDK